MKIYNKLVIDLTSGDILEEDSFDYQGPMSLAASGGGEPQTTTQTNDPWAGQQPYLTQIFNEASRLYGGSNYANNMSGWGNLRQGISTGNFSSGGGLSGGFGLSGAQPALAAQTPVPGSTGGTASSLSAAPGAAPSSVIPFSPETEQALSQQTQMAQTSPVSNSLDATIRGDYLYGGPGFDAAYQASADRIIPQVNSQFGTAGRSGSGLAQGEMTRQLGNAFAGQYGQERNNQMQALQMSPSVRYSDMDRLSQVGGMREGLQYEYAMEPWNRLGQYNSLVQGNYGGTTTTTQPTYRNRTAGALGGAAAGSYFGPWGSAAGGLLGYFA